jgi:hypothetical protein
MIAPKHASDDATGRAARLLLTHGYFRRSKFVFDQVAGHKEWLHFCIHAPEVDLLVNFSLVDDVRHRARAGAEFARVVCLARESSWVGDLDEFARDEVHVASGGLALRYGENSAVFRDGGFDLKVRMRRLKLELDLRLEPVTLPTLANNIFVDDCPPIQWIVLPRLLANGVIRIGNREHRVIRGTAYHDHNWGSFRWGKNFAWEWGYAAPEAPDNPFTLVFVRLCDRPHLTDLMRVMILWRGERQLRLFHSSEIKVWHEGLLRAKRVFKLPRLMGLVSPGDVSDVPKRFVARAQRGNDHLDLEFVATDLAQVVIPNDDDLGVTIINEVAGQVSVAGNVDGERVEISGNSIFEFLSE